MVGVAGIAGKRHGAPLELPVGHAAPGEAAVLAHPRSNPGANNHLHRILGIDIQVPDRGACIAMGCVGPVLAAVGGDKVPPGVVVDEDTATIVRICLNIYGGARIEPWRAPGLPLRVAEGLPRLAAVVAAIDPDDACGVGDLGIGFAELDGGDNIFFKDCLPGETSISSQIDAAVSWNEFPA